MGSVLTEEDHIETLLSYAEGKSVTETANDWGCSERCVAGRRRAAVAWLKAKNMPNALALAYQRGLLRV
jgi:hypothetical protein